MRFVLYSYQIILSSLVFSMPREVDKVYTDFLYAKNGGKDPKRGNRKHIIK